MALGSGQWMRVHAAPHPPGVLPRIGRLPAQCPASCSGAPAWCGCISHSSQVLAAGGCKQTVPRCSPHVSLTQSCAIDLGRCCARPAVYGDRGDQCVCGAGAARGHAINPTAIQGQQALSGGHSEQSGPPQAAPCLLSPYHAIDRPKQFAASS